MAERTSSSLFHMREWNDGMRRLLLAVAMLLALCAAACRRRPAYYLEKGNQSFDEQQYADAELNYKKALQADAAFGEAYYRLALVELRVSKPREAYQALSRASELLPARDDVKVALADF